MEKQQTVLTTDWGYMKATWTERGLWELDFPVKESPVVPAVATDELAAVWSEQLQQELNMYWRGFAVPFAVPLDWRDYTPFQAAVLRYTATIPYGETCGYGEVAAAIGAPKAARAVGGALNRNRVPIIVPCHRVIGASGKLTGFGGGLELKQALLLLESGGW